MNSTRVIKLENNYKSKRFKPKLDTSLYAANFKHVYISLISNIKAILNLGAT